MASTTVTLELPDELLDFLGPPDTVAAKVRESLVLDLLRDARISQGRAASLLGVTRWDILDLMARHAIPSGPETAEEVDQEINTALLGQSPTPPDAGG